jgi:hypothetical protein
VVARDSLGGNQPPSGRVVAQQAGVAREEDAGPGSRKQGAPFRRGRPLFRTGAAAERPRTRSRERCRPRAWRPTRCRRPPPRGS